MKVLIQNRVAGSRWTLPVTSLWTAAVWTADGLWSESWWAQAACYALCAYLMAELNNRNALIRTFTRLMSVSFLMFTCMAGNLGSLTGALTLLSIIGTLTLFFRTYQDRQSAGWTYYTFLVLSLGSLADIHLLLLTPVLWLLMVFSLQSMSWRTLFASLFGLATPYWFLTGWRAIEGDLTPLTTHLSQLLQWGAAATDGDWLHTSVIALLIVCGITGIVHFVRTYYLDKIRIRQYYYCFITISVIASILLVAQPYQHELLQELLIVSVSPLTAHFLALTHTRWTNMAFIALTLTTVTLTLCRLWMS